jgi:hypothetical protein
MAHFDKADERRHLDLFLAARKSAIGEELTFVADSESPDFVCRRHDGTVVGIEHTKVAYNPEWRDEISNEEWDEQVDDWEVFWACYLAVKKKEKKRQKNYWSMPNSTILVLDFVDGNALQSWHDDEDLSGDFTDSGFLEIWLMDHSSLEAYNTGTAIGLYPPSIWGINGQGHLGAPPYK